jgi:amino acid adenylation domain-containing protein
MISRVWDYVENFPHRIIVKDRASSLTWVQLTHRAAAYAKKIDRFTLSQYVPVIIDRSCESVTALLGVLLSGRAFSPLSAHQPAERILSCLRDLDADLVINVADKDLLPNQAIPQIFPPEIVDADNIGAIPHDFDPHQHLYVLFTSGSTGIPKGVIASNSNIKNTMLWSREIIDWQEGDVMGCASQFSFDISMFDFFTCLYFNVPLAIFSNPSDALSLVDEISDFSVTSIFSVPAFFSQFVQRGLLKDQRLRNLRRILSGGDFFPPLHVLAWMEEASHVRVYNVWGPTETSIVNTMHLVTDSDKENLAKGDSAPVGKCCERMPFVLLDEAREEVRRGDRGEICMLGDCVTQGYLKDIDRTNKVYFIHKGQRAFATQDIGYLDAEGEMHIIGRQGTTVKIAGYRIDLGEVERAAQQIQGIHLAGATVQEILPGIKEIWLGVETASEIESFDLFAFKTALRKILPLYMVPKRIAPFSRLPRSENQKINRKEIAEKIRVQSQQ